MYNDEQFEKLNANLETHFKHVKGAHLGADVGWYNIIYTLSNCIDNYLEWKSKSDKEEHILEVAQIKEKFGGLRYYTDGYSDDRIRGMIDLAESLSYTICEQCGKPGVLRKSGWMKTLCDEHEAERQERMKAYGRG